MELHNELGYLEPVIHEMFKLSSLIDFYDNLMDFSMFKKPGEINIFLKNKELLRNKYMSLVAYIDSEIKKSGCKFTSSDIFIFGRNICTDFSPIEAKTIGGLK